MLLNEMRLKFARFIERRSLWIIIAAALITVVLVPGNFRLETETGFDTMISTSEKVYKDTEEYRGYFGDEPVIVLIEGTVEQVFTSQNLDVLRRFEETFSPDMDDRFHSVVGPVTILKLAAEKASELGFEFPFDDPVLIEEVLNGEGGSQIAPLLPDEDHVLINVRPDYLAYKESIQVIREMEDFFEQPENQLADTESVKVIGENEMIETITSDVSKELARLLGLSMGVMAAILLLMFRVRWNLLSLFMVGIAAAWTFGAVGYAGVPLSMSSMAVLPILIGIGIDYSIQFHNRYQEEALRRKSIRRAIITSINQMFPVVGIALAATVIGFITLFISDVPMVQDFGKTLAVGVALSYIVGLFLLFSIVHLVDRKVPINKFGKVAEVSERATLLFEKILAMMAKVALRFPIPILLIAVAFGVAGGIADHWLESKVDHEEMMRQGSETLEDIRELRDITNYEGELHFLIQGDGVDVASPEVLTWMKEFQDEMLEHYADELPIVISPAKIISDTNGGIIPQNQEDIDNIFEDSPQIYVEQVIYDANNASLSFGVKHMPLEDVRKIIKHMEHVADPPENVTIAAAGNMALGSEAVEAMLGKRFLMNGLCMGAIFIVLVLVYRRFTRALFTMIPVGLVIGWVSFCLYLGGVHLNTMSGTLGVLVIGIGTEFIVLLLGRYEEEKKDKGESPHDAMVVAVSQTGRAIVTTAMTTLGGFGVLIASSFVMVRDFGVATTIGVVLCLISSMVVMPPLVVWWDTRIAQKLPKNL